MEIWFPYPTVSENVTSLRHEEKADVLQMTVNIIGVLYDEPDSRQWRDHPAVRMWQNHLPFLIHYALEVAESYSPSSGPPPASLVQYLDRVFADEVQAGDLLMEPPAWVSLTEVCFAHKSALMRKAPEYYESIFGPIRRDAPLLWPRG